MGVLADLVPKAQPALFGGGVNASGTEGATWLWEFADFTTDAGANINLTTVTGVCQILTDVGGTVVATLDFTGNANGTCTVGLDEADTAGLAAGATDLRRCRWSLVIDDATDTVVVWGEKNSRFYIYPGT